MARLVECIPNFIRTRLSKRLRQDALVPTVPAEFDVAEETEFQVVRTKHIATSSLFFPYFFFLSLISFT